MLKEFRDFIMRGNVLDLAVAVIIGAAFTAVVSALSSDIITPIIGVYGPCRSLLPAPRPTFP